MSLISLIVATGLDNEIGFQNKLLWHLPDDFKWFKKHTLGKPVIMGRKTFESIGKPLPGRLNIVVSSNMNPVEGIKVSNNLEDAIKLASIGNQEIFIIGGASIYEQTLKQAHKLYITKVHSKFEADVFFPKIDTEYWNQDFVFFHPKDEKHAFAFELTIWNRKTL